MTNNEGHWDGTHPEDVLSEEELDRVRNPPEEPEPVVTGPWDEAGTWGVIVEETTGFGRENQRWAITRTQPCADRNEARRTAFEFAERYAPEHPSSPSRRDIYQVGFDTWLVQVTGALRDYHFRVSAAQYVGSRAR